MDGNFVPNLTFGPELIAACRRYTQLPFETQLMVSQYCCDTMLEQFVRASAGPDGKPGVVIVHVDAHVHLHRALSAIRKMGGSPSVALNPHTPAEMIENVLDLVDHVLVMTVNPGFGGQAYIPTMLDKIRKIRKWGVDRGLDFDIEVDGGVKADWTIAACADAGANWCATPLCRVTPLPGTTREHLLAQAAPLTGASGVPARVRCSSFIAGSGMFKYDDLSVGCSELRTIAEAAQKGDVLQPGQTIEDLKKPVAA